MFIDINLGLKNNFKAINSIDLFNIKMYISRIYNRHSSNKTSLFKRCLFLKCIRVIKVADILIAAVKTRPLPLYYLYLL
jgi:hypothetical protein